MQVLAVDKLLPEATPEKMANGLIEELHATIGLYLEDKIRQFYFRGDRNGIVLILEVDNLADARAILDGLPFVRDGLLDFDLIPLAPLRPLELLVKK